jgi:formylglycine-generating enzyme required for sulfatase activity
MPGSPTSEHMMGITMNTTNANIQRLRSFVLALFLFMGRAHGVESAPYLVVDISGGVQADTFPLSELKAVPEDGWTEVYKTRKLVLRRVPAGTFIMGSPKEELGRPKHRQDEDRHPVTLTRDFYIGVFEVTQSQWHRVMGNWPSYFKNVDSRDVRPVEMVSYDLIRKDNSWPTTNTVHQAFFMGRMRQRTGLTFDLPTGAQWEYAGRAGTTNALNSGLELTDVDACLNLNALGRFIPNGNEDYTRDSGPEAGTAGVGSYAPNAWGLYDMHGNVWEWVLDWHPDGHRALGSIRSPQVDPRGTSHAPPGHPGRVRTARGGSWGNNASYCRSAMRSSLRGSITNSRTGFRLVVNFNESSGKPVRDP